MFGSFLVGSALPAATGPRGAQPGGAQLPALPTAPPLPSPQVLLTLDDDLDCVQRDKIYVF